MLPNIGPEFVEALLSRATSKPASHASTAASQSVPVCKRLDRRAPFRRITLLVLSRILVKMRLSAAAPIERFIDTR
jgi:hypothetical protein